MDIKTTLTIAGSDCSGGAGIQADIKTMTMNGVYAMSAITALTAQNTMGVFDIMTVSAEFLKNQLDAVFQDIRPDAVKIGMVSSAELIDVIAERLEFYQAENIVVDPVMVSTSGSSLATDDAVAAIKTKLLPLASLVTPNISEAQVLSNINISTDNDMIKAIKTDAPYVEDKISAYKKEILNEALSFLGINNINVEKKERLVEDEANANNEYVIFNLMSRLVPRKEACKKFNELFNPDKKIDVRLRSDLKNIIKSVDSIVDDFVNNKIEDLGSEYNE